MTACVMDLMHKGHLNILKEMRKEARESGHTVVFLHDDKSIYNTKGKIPIQNWKQRMDNLEITGFVDRTIKVTTYKNLEDKIEEWSASFRRENDEVVWLRGDDWADFPARKKIEELKIKIKLIPYTPEISSTMIRSELEKL